MMKQQTTTKQPARQTNAGTIGVAPAAFEQLEAVLRLMIAEHERMLAITLEHREAIKTADVRRLAQAIGKQNEIVQRVAVLERQRQGIVGAIMRVPVLQGPARIAQAQPTMTMVTAHAPEPLRSRLSMAAAALRELLHKLHREHMAVRSAAETLSAHMEGLMRQVCQKLSHAGTYARAGSSSAGVQVVSSMDVRS